MRTRTLVGISITLSTIVVAGMALSASAAQNSSYSAPTENKEHPIPPIADSPPIDPTDGPIIQLALLLDTSNSMDGLITQAKTRLWTIVNTLAEARHGEKPPQLQVSLYEYGNDGISPSVGHIRRRVAFTTDLDILSEQLFSLTTNGGQEYCGLVIADAVRDLNWIDTDIEIIKEVLEEAEAVDFEEQVEEAFEQAMVGNRHIRAPFPRIPGQPVVRMIVVAGNEPFTQGTTHFRESIADAVDSDIIVNTIYCGPHQEGASTGWQDGALLGNGRYTSIDQNRSISEIPTPFDDKLVMLNTHLNETYIPYGKKGRVAQERQLAQDEQSNIAGFSIRASRSASKASHLYSNTSWDLIDAYTQGTIKLDELEAKDLPEAMRTMTIEQMEKHLQSAIEKRTQVRKEITQANTKRMEFLAKNQKTDPDSVALHEALISMLIEQCKAQGLTFEKDIADEKESEQE